MTTWAIRQPELSSRLELPVYDNIGEAAFPHREAVWNQRIDELLTIRQLEDDWD